MLFSYGFIEDNITTARDVLLGLDIPEDDPLREPKKAVAADAPGVRLIDAVEGLRWESEYVWLICVNEEDGLELELLQSVDGERELQASWKGEALTKTAKLRPFLEVDSLWDVFHLRAMSVLQDRVEEQLNKLLEVESVLDKNEESPQSLSDVQSRRRALAARLRKLEFELLERFYEFFESEVSLTFIMNTDSCEF